MAFGEWLREQREARGLTQPQLAALVGVSQPAVVGWEAGAIPGGDRIKPLAEALGVGVDELAGLLAGATPTRGRTLRDEVNELRAAVERLEGRATPPDAEEAG